MSSERIYEEFEDDDWIDRHLDRVERAGRLDSDRLEEIADRQFRMTDQHLNGTIASFLARIEVLRRVPFQQTEG